MADGSEPTRLVDPFGERESDGAYTAGETGDRPWLLVGVAAAILAVLVGFFAFAADSGGDAEESDADREEPEPPVDADEPDDPGSPDDPPSTTEPPPEARISGRLDFAGVGELAPGRLVGTAEIGESLFAFTDPTESSGDFAGVGFERILSANERTPDGTWVDHGSVIEGIDVRDVAQHGATVVAVGIDDEGRGALWRSADGLTWAAEQLPLFTDLDGEPLEPSRVVANGDTIVVAAQPADDLLRFDRDLEAAGISIDLTNGWRFLDDQLVVYGPFWFVVDEYDLTALGIEPPDDSSGGPIANAWVNRGSGWELAPGQGSLRSVSTLPDGRFVRTIETSNRRIEFSEDGVTWESVNLPPFPGASLTASSDGLLVHDEDQLFRSADGATWEQIDVPVPSTPPSSLTDVHADDGTIVGVLSRLEEGAPEEIALLHDGLIVRFGFGPPIRLEQDGVITHEIDPFDPDATDHRFDPIEGLTFLDPESGEAITTLSMETLSWAFDEVYLDPPVSGRPITSILVSGVDEVWTRTAMLDRKSVV